MSASELREPNSEIGGMEEEQEPQLKYQRLASDVADILRRDEASCLCVSEKMLALGTHSGSVYLLSSEGDRVLCILGDRIVVDGEMDICFDEKVEAVGSCSGDGTCVVRSLVTTEEYAIDLQRPLTALALDPKFSSRKTREVITGGVAGKLILSSQGWLGTKNFVVHMGSGHIHTVKWSGSLVAWANDQSVKIYNTALHKHAGTVSKPNGSSVPPSSECFLYWDSDGTLYVGWGSAVMIVSFLPNDSGNILGQDCVRIVTKFDTEGTVAGVAPFGHQLAVLAYMKQETNDELGKDEPSKAQRPEIRVLTKRNAEISSDALSLNGYERYEAHDYKLVPCYPTSIHKMNGFSHRGAASGDGDVVEESINAIRAKCFVQWWKDGEQPMYYVISPKDIFVGTPIDELDRVNWLLGNGRFEKALSVATVIRKHKPETWDRVVDSYLKNLFSEERFEEAASLIPGLLGENSDRWERYIYEFASSNLLGVLAPHVPIQNPTLKPSTYNMILKFTTSPDLDSTSRLYNLVYEWPPSIYNAVIVAKDVHTKLHTIRGDRRILMEVLAQLYILQNKHEGAMDIYLELRRSNVFEFMLQHALLRFLEGKIIRLIALNEESTLTLLCDHHDEVDPNSVIDEVTAAMKKAVDGNPSSEQYQILRKWLHRYMDKLITDNISAAPDYHYLLVELYADYEPSRLGKFLRDSHQYPLDQAYEVCKAHKMIQEMVFILGRMGNTHEALQLIIKELADIPQAIVFAREQNDDHLWDSLINWAVGSASTTGALLDHVGGHVDPLRVITRIPNGMEICNLRERLCRIIADYRTQTSIQEGCNNILKADSVQLHARLFSEVRHCIRQIHLAEGEVGHQSWQQYDGITGRIAPTSEPKVEISKALDQPHSDEYANSPESEERSRQRLPLKLGYLLEDESQNGDHTESMRLKIQRRQSSFDETGSNLPTLLR